jgi:hypothetical protein
VTHDIGLPRRCAIDAYARRRPGLPPRPGRPCSWMGGGGPGHPHPGLPDVRCGSCASWTTRASADAEATS